MIDNDFQQSEPSPKSPLGEAQNEFNLKSPKHTAFVKHCALTGNYSEAARVAGYKSPTVAGCRLMKRPEIAAAVKLAQQNLMVKIESSHIEKARRLKKKDIWQAEIVLQMEQAQKEETKARLLEMLGKSESHFNNQDNSAPNINILNISHDELVKKAQSIMAKIRALPAPEYDKSAIIDTESSNS